MAAAATGKLSMSMQEQEPGYATNDDLVRDEKAAVAKISEQSKRDSSSEDSDAESTLPGGKRGGDDLTRLRREKRLAMNRESARARRKRKKVLLETLEQEVSVLSKKNQSFQVVNENLTARVNLLESELVKAKSTIALLTGQAARGISGSDPVASLLQSNADLAHSRLLEDELVRQRALMLHGSGAGSLGRLGIHPSLFQNTIPVSIRRKHCYLVGLSFP